MCLVWGNRRDVDAAFYDAVEFDPMLTVAIGKFTINCLLKRTRMDSNPSQLDSQSKGR